jgi:CTP:molybdopterin cytidylyltransferase MocA
VITAIVPAAGRGTRLGASGPKALARLGPKSLLVYVLQALEASIDSLVLVVRPGDEPLFAAELRSLAWDIPTTFAVQPEATGSADAVTIGLGASPADAACIITWADQVGLSNETVREIAARLRRPEPPLVMPLVQMADPYVWVEFDDVGSIQRIGRQRDGDESPSIGFADLGLFGMPCGLALSCLAEDAGRLDLSGRERDFVYVLPRLASACGLQVITVEDGLQAMAINTSDDLRRAERVLGVAG